jgi:hypothetical protein
LAPGTEFADAWHRLDLRLSKLFEFGGRRVLASLDVFNALNGAGVVTHRTTYGPGWLNPTAILGPRFFRVSGQFDF